MLQNDTIAAISTPAGSGGIGIIRISGPEALNIADKMFFSSDRRLVSSLSGYQAAYGKIIENDTVIDEGIALIFISPASYTGEDVVEISVHGGIFIVKSVLRAVIAAGARLATPGEFTRRAFENGKLDLTQAESVMQLINAAGEDERRVAMSARDGALSKKVAEIRSFLLICASDLAAYTDYPDEDIPDLESGVFLENLRTAEKMLEDLISTYDAGQILREGIDTVIAGRPNVGKSTLMNLLTGSSRSIVTDIAGTTRDVVEESVMLDGIRLKLSDTAGLRETDDPVESIGVDRSKEKLATAQLILAILDASSPLDADDLQLLEQCKGRRTIVIINKSDLAERIDRKVIESFGLPTVTMSAISGGADALISAVKELTRINELDTSSAILASERQHACAAASLKAVRETITALDSGITLDAVGVCLDDALAALFSLTGERVTMAVADEVFSRFCVGK